MASTTQYLELITSEHQFKPKFEATVDFSTALYVQLQNALCDFPRAFDVDEAVGVQLDVIGIWVGRSRRIAIPLTGVYFTWDDVIETGWDAGVWKGEFDPDTGLVELPDDVYRRIIKAKIAANNWNGTVPGAYEAWAGAFGEGNAIVIEDNQDMSMNVGLISSNLTTVDIELLVNGEIPLKPEGVRVNYYAVANKKIFAWDVENDVFGGWDDGEWARFVNPVEPPFEDYVLVNGFLVTVNGSGVFI